MSASIREIARQAGVGLATIYRQFPTKEALFEAVVKQRVADLRERAERLAEADDPRAALFDFFSQAVAYSTGERALVDYLATAGVDIKTETAPLYRELEDATEVLLGRAQAAGAIRQDIGLDELVSLIVAASLAAERQQWDEDLRSRVLTVMFDGLASRP